MGNRSNLDQWATMERMRFIERSAYWRGVVNRQDLAGVFGLSMAQASADLQKYQQENPGALLYNLNRKRYEGTEGMVMKFAAPVLEEAMAMFLTGGAAALGVGMPGLPGAAGEGTDGTVQVRVVRMPQRRAVAAVERRIFLAVLQGVRVRARYRSVNSGSDDWRWLWPRVFAHNGSRWHVRAWCEQRGAWADFTLSRIVEAEWPVPGGTPPPPDGEAGRMEVLKLRAHRDLTPAKKAAVEQDFGMKDGVLEVPVNALIADYLRSRLHLPLADGTLPAPLVEPAD